MVSGFCCAAAGVVALGADVATFRLKSGEVIKGELVSENAGQVQVRSAALGTVTLQRDQIAAPEAAPPKPPKPAPAAKAPEKVRNWNAELGLSVSTRDSDTLVKTGSGNTVRRVSDTKTTRVNGKVKRQFNKSSLEWAANYHYRERNGRRDDDRYSASQVYKRTIQNRFFFETESRYTHDYDRALVHELWQTAGLGYHWLKSKKLTLETVLSGAYQYLEEENDNTDKRFTPGFNERFNWQITDSLKFFQKFEFLGDDERYFSYATLGGEKKLIGNLLLRMNYSYTYDTTLNGREASQIEDTRTSLVYRFKF